MVARVAHAPPLAHVANCPHCESDKHGTAEHDPAPNSLRIMIGILFSAKKLQWNSRTRVLNRPRTGDGGAGATDNGSQGHNRGEHLKHLRVSVWIEIDYTRIQFAALEREYESAMVLNLIHINVCELKQGRAQRGTADPPTKTEKCLNLCFATTPTAALPVHHTTRKRNHTMHRSRKLQWIYLVTEMSAGQRQHVDAPKRKVQTSIKKIGI